MSPDLNHMNSRTPTSDSGKHRGLTRQRPLHPRTAPPNYSFRAQRTGAAYPRTKLTNWPKGRTELDNVDTSHLSPEVWSATILSTISQHTKDIARTDPHIDSHLISMWNEHRAIFKSWHRRKQNTTLRARMDALNQECQDVLC
ncbi:hypothetical protein HPB47_011175 [Ixodes persulcatus]|uniref:Uncharacterized protein n=1 Tax=Ixodes persulcatus TaxID=34615 RepID=A0AC60NX90_IXOPE|nr:hypothetical protein HPB47_011175 [Ixodes persulcatus]